MNHGSMIRVPHYRSSIIKEKGGSLVPKQSFLSDNNLWITFVNFMFFVSAWIFVFCLIQFCSEVINIILPGVEWKDTLMTRNFQRGITAGLLISSLFSSAFSYVINSQFKKDPSWKHNVIRKVLIYLWLAVLFIVVIVNLIVTTVSFLTGDISLNSPVRLFVVLVVSGIIYYFYLSEVRNFKNIFRNFKINIGLLLILTSFLCIISFNYFGGPLAARDEYQDRKLEEAIQNVRSNVDLYYSRNKKLPSSEELSSKIPAIARTNGFEYKILSSEEFEICAIFRNSNAEVYASNPNFVEDDYTFIHQEGLSCKKFKSYLPSELKPEAWPMPVSAY